ncbi:MAG: hypothetical protein HW401_418 [Parcubacteria group bacterium]|nr:hypothetical protein [Parcubacteria group bacterium]
MNYPLRNSSKPRNKNKRLKFLIAAIIFAILFLISLTGAFKISLNNIILPFWKSDSYIGQKFSNTFSIIGSKKSLIAENRRLGEELNKIKADLSIQKIIQKENEDLKALLGRDEIKKNAILSAVLVRPSISPFDIIIIDVGLDKGVKAGDRVLYEGSVAIGEVEEAYVHSSKIKLYSSPGEKFIALVGERSVQVEAEGLGGGNFSAKLPRDIEVNEGDAAVVPSISASIFGFVQKIELNPTDSFQKIIFKIPVNLSELKWVTVEI